MAKQSKKNQSPGQKAQFLVYASQGRALKNKAARLVRHVRANPKDVQSAKAKASGHTRAKPLGHGPVVIFSGFRIIGEKTIKSAKTGKMFKVPVFEFVPERMANGLIPNRIKRAKHMFFNRIENRPGVGVTAQELKAGLGF